jgi:hypothetical protein
MHAYQAAELRTVGEHLSKARLDLVYLVFISGPYLARFIGPAVNRAFARPRLTHQAAPRGGRSGLVPAPRLHHLDGTRHRGEVAAPVNCGRLPRDVVAHAARIENGRRGTPQTHFA